MPMSRVCKPSLLIGAFKTDSLLLKLHRKCGTEAWSGSKTRGRKFHAFLIASI